MRLTFHIVLCIFTKDSVEVVLSCERRSRPTPVPQTTFRCQKWSGLAKVGPGERGEGNLTVKNSPVVPMVIPLDPYQ